MKGTIRIERENLKGKETILDLTVNYVLKKTKARLLNGIYGGTLPVDPITSFRIGSGGATEENPGSPVNPSTVDGKNDLHIPLVCANQELVNDLLYDGSRLVHNLQNMSPYAAYLSGSSPKKVVYSFHIDFAEANGVPINEVGLVTRGGDLFNYKSFPTVTKTSEDKLNITWTLEYK